MSDEPDPLAVEYGEPLPLADLVGQVPADIMAVVDRAAGRTTAP